MRTRYLDTIFKDNRSGRYFTVQEDRVVPYKGKKTASLANSNG